MEYRRKKVHLVIDDNGITLTRTGKEYSVTWEMIDEVELVIDEPWYLVIRYGGQNFFVDADDFEYPGFVSIRGEIFDHIREKVRGNIKYWM